MGEFAEALPLIDSVLGWVDPGNTARLGVLHCRAARCAIESDARTPERALVAIEHTAGVLDRVPDAHAAPARGLHALLAAVLNSDAEAGRRVTAAGVGADYYRALVRLAEAVVAGARGDSAAAEAAANQGYRDLTPFPAMSAIATVLLAPQAFDGGWADPAGRLAGARDCFGTLGNER